MLRESHHTEKRTHADFIYIEQAELRYVEKAREVVVPIVVTNSLLCCITCNCIELRRRRLLEVGHCCCAEAMMSWNHV